MSHKMPPAKPPKTKAAQPSKENVAPMTHRGGDGKFKAHPAEIKGMHKRPKQLNPDPQTGDNPGEGM